MLSTSTILSLLGISAMQVVAGLSVGYWLRSRRMAVSKTSDALTRRLTDALGRIQTLADDFGAEAIDHVEQVKAVARTLNDAAEADIGQLHQALLEGMSQIVTANSRLQTQLSDVESKLEEQSLELETQMIEARLDMLTTVPNRRAFDEELSRRLAEWRRRPAPLSIMLIDLDHFRKINDRRGRAVGDAVLRDTARVLQAVLREMDFLARFGGEEFAVILPSTSLRDARRAAQRAIEAVAKHGFEYDHEPVTVTVSLGLAEAAPGDDVETLLRRADDAVYLSKAAGRNCGHFHSGEDFLSLDSPRLTVHESHEAEQAGRGPLAAAEGRVRHDAASEHVDGLTQLPSPGAFSQELRRRVQRCRAENRKAALVLVDVDRLEETNEHGGRAAGDALLRRTADAVRGACGEADFAARYHKGQFALVLDETSLAAAVGTAERLRGELSAAGCTVSCGVAEVRQGDRSVAVAMRAGTALAAAKSSGRDCTFVHDGQAAEPADQITA